jgi:LAGLIDADG DNA endonuclease family
MVIFKKVEIGQNLTKNRPARLSLNQSTKKVKFALWVFNILAHYCQSVPYLFTAQINGKKFYSFQTRTFPCLTLLHSAWYLNGIKVIPASIFEDLTPFYCFSSVGNKSKSNGRLPNY